jgi:hypothetical protein
MAALGVTDLVPGWNVTTDQEWRSVLPGLVQPTFQYPCCTAAMGARAQGGVVDPASLRVWGVRGVECGGCEFDAGDCGGAFDGDGVLCCRECEAILSLQMSLLPLFWFVHIVRSVRNRC